ncbi:MAG: translation elongation factor Ts [Candidatus Omnitrophota bacterium]
MAVSIELIKQLRDMTLASVADCKKALDDAQGDLAKASVLLKKRGLEIAAKKASRAANQGRIEAYVHTGNKIGVVLEVNCETDFVARNEEFVRFTKDVAMQIAASAPLCVNIEEVPAQALAEFNEAQRQDYAKTHCLLDQPFIRDPKQTIRDYLTSIVARLGENIVVRRFCRFKIGEE